MSERKKECERDEDDTYRREKIYTYKRKNTVNLQFICNVIRLLTAGGTSLEAIQR